MQVQANGISMHYTMDGPADAPVVVLGHSLSANLAMWDGQMQALAQYRVLRYDTRGHGATIVREPGYVGWTDASSGAVPGAAV